MLEEFRNKKVKILVGSNSGVAIGAGRSDRYSDN